MPRRSSLTVPLTGHDTTHRRSKSADDRPSASIRTPATPAPRQSLILGKSRNCPIDLSSEDDEGGDGDRVTLHVAQSRQIVEIRDDASRPRPGSAEQPRSQQPTTPDRDRPQPHREPASDPGPTPRTRNEAFRDRLIAYQQENRLPCGRKEYTSPNGKWSKRHRNGCPKCLNYRGDQHETKESEDEEVPMLRKCTTADLRDNDHDSDKSSDSNNYNDKNEKNQEASRAREDENAPMLHHRLIQAAKENLTSDEKAGYLYVVRNPENPGLLKLGCSLNGWKRVKQHKGRCGLLMTWVYISNCVEKMRRAEKLAKLDMGHLQRDWKCSLCSQTHKEWFEVDEEKAKKVIKRWLEWINEQTPYTSSGDLEPMWEWLMDFRRAPRHDFAEDDHEVRWDHWDRVLLPPSDTDTKRFQNREKLKLVNQQPEGEATHLEDEQPASKDRRNKTIRPSLTIAEQASSEALGAQQNGNTYNIINSLHVKRDFLGSASKLSLSWR